MTSSNSHRHPSNHSTIFSKSPSTSSKGSFRVWAPRRTKNSYMTRSGCQSGQGWALLLRAYIRTCCLAELLTIDTFDWSSKLPGLRIKTHGGDLGSPSHTEVAIRPKERSAIILSQIEREMLRQKDRDHQWDDHIDVSYPFLEIIDLLL